MRSVRRNTELGLLVLGTMVTVGAYVLASLAKDSRIPANIGPFLAVILGVQLVGHIAVRRLAPEADGMLLPLASLLNGLGYVFIVRVDEARREPAGLAGLQSTWVILGMVAFVATLVVVRQSRSLERYRYTAGLIGLALLLLPLVPGIGNTINGSRIWVSLGPVNFQPGEFAKLALAIFFAGYLVDKRELLAIHRAVGPFSLPDPKHLGPVLLAWGASLVIMVAERDLGSSLLFFALFIVLLWVATERISYVVVGSLLFAAGAFFSISTFTHVQERIDIWLDPWCQVDPETSECTYEHVGGEQLARAAFSMADGGVVGRGLNLGTPEDVPLAETDFIFAAITEELGLLGSSAVLVAFILLIGAGLRIAQKAANGFDRLLAVGLTTLLGLQAFIIIAGVVRLLPLTGVTLPFVSYGGSSLLANYVILALLLRISDNAEPRTVDATVMVEAV
ncbi:MAG TPA: FtsW/RodA/SpoVE family cell cycle protein [Chloroflexota bacterium]|nr:FtsW/RodA/SpoVE family cell cycle protein [Chloroflexota bacterium]